MTATPRTCRALAACVTIFASSCKPPLEPKRPEPQVLAIATRDASPHPPSSPDRVAIVAGRRPAGNYEFLGVVAVTAYRDDDAVALLRSAGARLGADVVTEVRMSATAAATSLWGVALATQRVP